MSLLCEEIDGKVKTVLERPIEGDWPDIWISATYLKICRGGCLVSAFFASAWARETPEAAAAERRCPRMMMSSSAASRLGCSDGMTHGPSSAPAP